MEEIAKEKDMPVEISSVLDPIRPQSPYLTGVQIPTIRSLYGQLCDERKRDVNGWNDQHQ
jgi:hypothetical protein